MITSIEIQNFRNLKNLNIDSLSRVNLIIGKNNTGKTNFLESINFYSSQNEFLPEDKLIIDDLAPGLLSEDEIFFSSYVKFIGSHSSIQSFLRQNTFDIFSDLIREKALKCLKIMDDRIMEIDFVADNLKNPIATFKNGKNVALLRMGNGIHRILTVLLALSTSENGIILIDEIENGIHYSVQEAMWDMIFEISERLNVQVFAATQSIDTIRSFGEIVNQIEEKPLNGILIKLENIDNAIEPLIFNPDELKVITQNSIEVRR
ncbi:ATP/GTP-binding protein [Dyadobacter sp. CY356]|uniref:AAA family ATPase n=1 Tax=Dyadobacter sp. CY356 TaxID=2906442 RepID=UPI001F19275F|nr:AAA family ATPase [Dyadobacter sp. CY356]MCF0059571.1 AAA family ATPase [Dyadobacter sp. CY356]